MNLKKAPQSTIHVGPAFNMNLVVARKGCNGCDNSLLSNVAVNGKSYGDAVSIDGEFNVKIEQYSGYMIETVKDMSFFLYLESKTTLPFPDLDSIGSQMIPLFDKQELLQIDFTKFNSRYGFIQSNFRTKLGVIVAFPILFGLFLIAAIAGTVIVCKRKAQIAELEEQKA